MVKIDKHNKGARQNEKKRSREILQIVILWNNCWEFAKHRNGIINHMGTWCFLEKEDKYLPHLLFCPFPVDELSSSLATFATRQERERMELMLQLEQHAMISHYP